MKENTQAYHDKLRDFEVQLAAAKQKLNEAKNLINDSRRWVGNGSFAQFDGKHEDSVALAGLIDEWLSDV